MNQKSIIAVLGVVVIVLIGTTVYFATINKVSKPVAPAPKVAQQPVSVPTPIVQPTDETISWQTYSNTKYGFEFQYPKTWKTQSREIGIGWGEKDYIWFDSDFSVSISDTSMYSLDQLKEAPPGGIDPASLKEKSTMLGGSSATEVAYTRVGDAGSGSKQMKKIAISKNSLVYVVECVVNDCEKVIPTFKFTK